MVEKLLRGSCIGFAGKIYAGKTTLANNLKKYINKYVSDVPIEIHSFADPLRELSSKILGFPISSFKHNFLEIDDHDKINVHASIENYCFSNKLMCDEKELYSLLKKANTFDDLYRVSLQYIGTELYRKQVDVDYWANEFQKYISNDKLVITDDVRMLNELKIVNTFGVSIYIIPKYENIQLMNKNNSFDGHSSENSISSKDCDIEFLNNIQIFKNGELENYFNIISCGLLEDVLQVIDLKRDPTREYGGI